MKKRILKWMPLFCLVTLCVGFVSCGDDDDDNAGATSAVPSPKLTDANGVPFRVTSFGNWYYSYDSNGKLTKIQRGTDGDDEVYDLSGSAFVMNYKEVEDDGESWTESTSISLNGQGFVGSLRSTWEEKESDGEWEKGTESVTCTYNNEGRLVKFSCTGNYNGNDDGKNYSGSYTTENSLTWENGKLTSIVETWNEDEDGEKRSGTETMTFTYGSKANTSKQWLYAMTESGDGCELAEDVMHCLSPLGLFGYGPDYFPTKYTESEDGHNYDVTLTYEQNPNGTIHKDNYKAYTYDEASAATRAQMRNVEVTRNRVKYHDKRRAIR